MPTSEVAYADNTWVELSSNQGSFLRAQFSAQAELALNPTSHRAGLHHNYAGYFTFVDADSKYGMRTQYDVVYWPNPYLPNTSCALARAHTDAGLFVSFQLHKGSLSAEGVLMTGTKSYYGRQELVTDPDDLDRRNTAWVASQFFIEGKKRAEKGELDLFVPAIGRVSMSGVTNNEIGRLTVAMNSYGVGVSAASAIELQRGQPGATAYRLAGALLDIVNASGDWKPEDEAVGIVDGAGRQVGVSFQHPLGLIALSHGGDFPHNIVMRVANRPLTDELYSIVKQYAIYAHSVFIDYVAIEAEQYGPNGIAQAVSAMSSDRRVGSPLDNVQEPIMLEGEELQAFHEQLLSILSGMLAAKKTT